MRRELAWRIAARGKSIAVGCALGWLDFRFNDDNWRSTRPQLARWYEGFSARASMQATLPKA